MSVNNLFCCAGCEKREPRKKDCWTYQRIDGNSELNSVKGYLQNNNKSSINQQEINALLDNNSSIPVDSPNNNNLGRNLAIGAGSILVIGLFIGLLVKRSKSKAKKHY